MNNLTEVENIKLEINSTENVQAAINESCCKGDYYNNRILVTFIKDNSKRYYMSLSIEI